MRDKITPKRMKSMEQVLFVDLDSIGEDHITVPQINNIVWKVSV